MQKGTYVNVRLAQKEHAALVRLAKREGRAKGAQLRVLAVSKLSEIGVLPRNPKLS